MAARTIQYDIFWCSGLYPDGRYTYSGSSEVVRFAVGGFCACEYGRGGWLCVEVYKN